MLIREFTEIDSLIPKLVTFTDQLKTMVDKNPDQKWTVDQLLYYFSKYGIDLDKEDLYDMIKKKPLKKVISNIQGDSVVFKGQEKVDVSSSNKETDKQKEIVSKMAKKAMK